MGKKRPLSKNIASSSVRKSESLSSSGVASGGSGESSDIDTFRADVIRLEGVQENNLKNITVSIPHDRMIAITGLSGSGKSTLAMDTIYAEGGRRYIETFSPYTRQFLDRLHQPKLDAISGVRPALALEQRNRSSNSRSTVGTVTEINDYLKVIWSHLADTYCPECNILIPHSTPFVVRDELLRSSKGKSVSVDSSPMESFLADSLLIAFAVVPQGEASLESLAVTLSRDGFVRFFDESSGEVRDIESLGPSKRILVVVDRFRQPFAETADEERRRLISSINQAYTFGHGELFAVWHSRDSRKFKVEVFREFPVCPKCEHSPPKKTPSLFTFNSPLGACQTCHGFGKILAMDPDLVVPDPKKTLAEGAISCWGTPSTRREMKKLKSYCEQAGIDLHTPWLKLPSQQRETLLKGTKDKKIFYGVSRWFEYLQQKRHKMHIRIFLSRFRREFLCPTCEGTRLRREALSYRLHEKTLPEIWKITIEHLVPLFENLAEKYREHPLAEIALEEVLSRASYLQSIGLGYLTLDRQTRTLSGGENQRVNLTALLGARLVNTMLVLDEPTIGLHAEDTHRLISSISALRDRGNTVLVVEHDTELIKASDQVIDIGPESGGKGGEIIFQGSAEDLENEKRSYTAKYLSPDRIVRRRTSRKINPRNAVRILGARANNLKNIDVDIPLGGFVVLTGVSGSGKSSFVEQCLTYPYERLTQGIPPEQLFQGNSSISGFEGLEKIRELVLIDQSPAGKTPRSNSATYTKAWDIIRDCLAETETAKNYGLSRSAFSFNVDGGRCPICKGAGHLRVEMQFLADVFVECEACGGYRFQDKVLSVTFAGKNVIELLDTSLEDVVELFRSLGETHLVSKAVHALQPLIDLGLGYLRLGHPLSQMSGGEAQRLKLASYLQEESKKGCLFLVDEPTTGLHPHNVQQLLSAFDQLIERGHSILCIEHNLEVILQADWMIDLGPGAGAHGGEIVTAGVPGELLKNTGKRHASSKTLAALSRYLDEVNYGRKSEIEKKRIEKASTRKLNKDIRIEGAKHHNLKNVSVSVPENKLTVITGVSGSGKSSLAFDILFAEGQRRYIDCLSPYARQYMKQLSRAAVDRVVNIPPTISVSQKTSPPLGITTVATTTEIYQYLRLLYSKVGTQHCPHDNARITSYSAETVTNELLDRYAAQRIFLFAPAVSGRKGYYNDLFQRALKAEINEARIDGKLVRLTEDLRLERHKLHWISLLIGSINNPAKNPGLLRQAVDHALLLGGGTIEIAAGDKHEEPEVFSTERVCPKCKRGYRPLDPQDFSFRSQRGICKRCDGRGRVAPGRGKKSGDQEIPCPECHGARIGALGRHVYLDGKSIDELAAKSPGQLLEFVESFTYESRLAPVIAPVLRELKHRLKIILSVGLDYLHLNREANTISGGEAQRLRLAKTLGSPLSGVCYILDEPSIGLHPQDQQQLMGTLESLKSSGNTVIVVEHDEELIRQAEHVIDIGPAGGANGGELVYQGDVTGLESCERSLTGEALRVRTALTESGRVASAPRGKSVELPVSESLVLTSITTNNLKAIDVSIPLKRFTAVCGVSGAGKSSLVHGSVVPAVVAEILEEPRTGRETWKSVKNANALNRLIEIDQTPVGKTITSTPASFLGVFDEIRKFYAALPESKIRGWTPGYFSFNSGKGRCQDCSGRGFLKIPMSFLPEATSLCETCNGLRYNDSTKEVLFMGLSIGEILQKTISEAHQIFVHHPRIRKALDVVVELGLGYINLGQPTYTLSGGETQRLKIARELGAREAVDTLYILDEPTIGLHMTDVDKLLRVLRALVDKGNTLIVIEHNIDVLRACDYLIEVGPGPGERGGELLFSGSPGALKKMKSTPTKPFLFPTGAPAAPASKDESGLPGDRVSTRGASTRGLSPVPVKGFSGKRANDR